MNSSSDFTIARVIARLNIGGPAIQAILMTDEFRRRGYRTLLLTGEVPPGEGSMDYLARNRDVVPIKVGTLSREISWSKDLITLWQLVKIFRRERPLVVHTHTAKAGTVGRLAAILTRVPVRVHTFHGHVFSGYFGQAKTRAYASIERFLARFTTRIVTVSEGQARELSEIYRIASRAKIQVMRNGFDWNDSAPRAQTVRSAFGIRPDQMVVLWMGRMVPIK